MEALERYSTSNDLPTLIVVTVLLLLVVSKKMFPHRFEDFIALFNSGKYLIIKSREHKAFYGFNILMLIVHILCVSLFLLVIFRTLVSSNMANMGIIILRIVTAYSFFVLLKITVEKIIANVFDIDDIAEHYLFQKHTFRNFISLLLFPVTIFLIYAPSIQSAVIYTVIGIFFSAIIYAYIRIVRKNLTMLSPNWFYFILYLCALEITPYVILYKLITTI